MKSLDYTLEKLPGNPLELPNSTLPLGNPQPILQQTKSQITTNPFIKEAPVNLSFNEINKKVSVTFMSILEELFNKPENENWNEYLSDVFQKEDRLNYIAILIFFIVLYILLIK